MGYVVETVVSMSSRFYVVSSDVDRVKAGSAAVQ